MEPRSDGLRSRLAAASCGSGGGVRLGQTAWVSALLEREGELAAVEALFERGGGVLVVEGATGTGKTALVEAACLRGVSHGHDVLRARGSELEAGFAFGVV